MALRPAALTTSLLLAALLAACAGGPAGQPAARIAPETPPAPSAQVAVLAPQANNLDATAWMQTSAEYRAAVAGSYALARQQLDAALADPAWDALPPEERAAIRPAAGLPCNLRPSTRSSQPCGDDAFSWRFSSSLLMSIFQPVRRAAVLPS